MSATDPMPAPDAAPLKESVTPQARSSTLFDEAASLPWIVFPLATFLFAFYQSAVVLRPSAHLVSDMAGYLERGRALALGAPFRPYDLFYPPGTSYLIASLFKVQGLWSSVPAASFPVFLLSALWSVCIALGTLAAGLLAAATFPRKGAAPAAMLLTTLYWPFAALASFLMSEPPFIGTALFGYALLCRELLGRQRIAVVIPAALLLGCGCLVRGQGLVLVATVLIVLLMLPARQSAVVSEAPLRSGTLVLCAIAILCGVLLPILLHLRFVSHAAGHRIGFLAANDAFNLYLGQSRRGGVGALDAVRGEYYLFFNNNSGTDLLFEPFEAVAGAITDRSLFFRKTATLWGNEPAKQLVRSLQNLRELFLIRPSWPLTAYEPRFTRADVWFQWCAVFLGLIPALGIAAHDRRAALLLGLPVLLLAVSAAASTGQPRYLTPFLLLAFAGAAPVIGALTARGADRARPLRVLRTGMWLALCAWGASKAIGLLYGELHSPRPPHSIQTRYHLSSISPSPTPLGIKGWFTVSSALDRLRVPGGAEELKPLRAADGVSLRSHGFSRKEVITPTFAAERPATITVRFPPASASHVAFFLVDPDNRGRISVLRADTRVVLGQELYPGRWVSFPLSAAEQAAGSATVELSPLAGGSVELSAVLLYLADTDHAPAPLPPLARRPLQSACAGPLQTMRQG